VLFRSPSKGVVNISIEEVSDQAAVVEISGMDGRIAQTAAFKGSISIDLSSKPRGIYIVNVSTGKKKVITKINIE
jgi:hypothetical protein